MLERTSTYRSEDGHGFFAEPHRIEDVVVEDGLEQVVLVVGLERRLSGHHLVHQHPERPPVHGGSVLQLLQDLVSTAAGQPGGQGQGQGRQPPPGAEQRSPKVEAAGRLTSGAM